ncbi:hypothetical protein [Pimelobacter simplex]|uniref:hypothetical protein n=1 Tax=Nocardioides simplex TaxID=2045 RepID=UPI00256FBB88
MACWRHLDDRPPDWRGCVVTMGVFDGFHLGHQAVVRAAVEDAHRKDLPCVLVTFDPHPLTVVDPARAPRLLLRLAERLRRVQAAGVDVALVLPFTARLAATTAEQFISEVLVDGLGARSVVVGANFRFGRGNSGDVAALRDAGEDADFTVHAVPLVEVDGEVCSSTRVRRCLDDHDLAGAASLVGSGARA